MKSITPEHVSRLINFAPTERARKMGFADSQLQGATAAFNMLQRNGVAYVADEVGMGKTYVALGVMGLVRHQNPSARIMVIAPRENIQLKWIKEQSNFIRDNWLNIDNCIKTFNGGPARKPVACGNTIAIANAFRYEEHSDLFLRATSFSVRTKSPESRKRLRREMQNCLPWMPEDFLRTRDSNRFRDNYGRALNALIPDIDLLVVDEAHNFRHGFGENVSTRNRVLGAALGHPQLVMPNHDWYAPRVKNILLLSATPFEYDYSDLYQQLNVFGKAQMKFKNFNGFDALDAALLKSGDEAVKREVVKRFLIRRVQYMKIGNEQYSKNMYRRGWREGGLEDHDQPIEVADPKQRLIVGLIQKKVAEVLGDRKFNNSFQIGMLSSFESFMETISRRKQKVDNGSDQEEQEAVFDGDQKDVKEEEKRGVDSFSLEKVVSSYKEKFGKSLPHPKLDAISQSLTDSFDTGEKSLIFVRRIATVAELRSKLNDVYDFWIKNYMRSHLLELDAEVVELFEKYEAEKSSGQHVSDLNLDENETLAETRQVDAEDDDGGTDSFFAWFFRGKGPSGMLSGAAFQKNRLTSADSVYALIFEDNHVSRLLGFPEDVTTKIVEESGISLEELKCRLRLLAFRYFRSRSQQDRYSKIYVFEAYQYAALTMLGATDSFGFYAREILEHQYRIGESEETSVPTRFPDPEGSLNQKTFFTELTSRVELRDCIWPRTSADEQTVDFKEREQRRLLISSMARLGASFVDLYLIAIKQLGSFELRTESTKDSPEAELIKAFLDLLEQQRNTESKFNAFFELSKASETFELLLAVNFPEARGAELSELAKIFGRVLQHQVPVGWMSGGVNKRMVKQFRMPGYPLVLPTTDVLQEGEDLHTFCQRVIHYGIAWTPSAMEQRTGRVDRIGSLAQRNLDGSESHPSGEDLIQVHYPHLSNTVERLQVRRVLERLNEFLRLIHCDASVSVKQESKIDLGQAFLEKNTMPPMIEGCLKPDFPVSEQWLQGELDAASGIHSSVAVGEAFFKDCCHRLEEKFGINGRVGSTGYHYDGKVAINCKEIVRWDKHEILNELRVQPFSIALISHKVGNEVLIRIRCSVGIMPMSDEHVDVIYEAQKKIKGNRLCIREAKNREYAVSIECDRVFDSDYCQAEEIERAFRDSILQGDMVRQEIRKQTSLRFKEQ
eukprot:COSAG01_NODE_1872_length_9006_cov_523.219153_5_plen_1180_part_00